MGCIMGKSAASELPDRRVDEVPKGHELHQHGGLETLSSESDGMDRDALGAPKPLPSRVVDTDTDATGIPTALPRVRSQKRGTPKLKPEKGGTPKLKSEKGGTPKLKSEKGGTPKLRSASGTPKLRSATATPKIRSDKTPTQTPKLRSSWTPKFRLDGGTPKVRTETPKVRPDSRTPKSSSWNYLKSNAGNRESPSLHALDLDSGSPYLAGLSDEYLPVSGSRVVTVPARKFELQYSYLTQRGYYPEDPDKTNQDSFCVHTSFGDDPNDHFFGVFDGHGEFGTDCAQFAQKHLCRNLLRNRHFGKDVIQAYHSAFVATNLQLHRYNINDSMSGTTGITVLVRGSTLYVANVGDSRAVIAKKKGKKLVAVDLSSDQTPYRADECARVKNCGARVLTLDQVEGLKDPTVQCWEGEDDDDGDPPRLWVANGMYPGTAFTRSIGDTVAEQIGVIAVPEVLVMELTPKNPFFVIASDGVFEFLSSQAVIDMVAKYKDPKDACAAIVAESYRLWLQYETRTDDITIIVVWINGLQQVAVEEPEPQLVQTISGRKSPVRIGREASKAVRPARNDLSKARGAIEALLEQDEPWVPPSEPHPKTPEEEGLCQNALIDQCKQLRHGISQFFVARFRGSPDDQSLDLLCVSGVLFTDLEAQITRAMRCNFLFQSLTQKQRHTLCECMDQIDVCAGDIVIRQGSEGDLFYIVENGEFEVLISQNTATGSQALGTVVHCYDADSSPCFGELALICCKPRQATVRAVTDGSLWVLEREAFRGVLMMRSSQRPSLKLLRSVEILANLSLSQLHCLADALTKVSFAAGETIVRQDDVLDTFYLVLKGHVEVTYHDDSEDQSLGVFQLPRASLDLPGGSWARMMTNGTSETKEEVKCIGEWVLLDAPTRSITALAIDNVECWAIKREEFEEAVGPLSFIIKEEKRHMEKMACLRNEQLADVDERLFAKISLKDLDWQETVYSTDCCEVGLALCKNSDDIVSVKRYRRRKVLRLGREGQVLLERSLFKSLRPSPYVPCVLATLIDNDSAALVLNCALAGPLELILHTPLDEPSARYMVASVIVAIELLHKDGVIYRGVSPDVLMIDRKGRLQLVDFRFAKQMSDERTYTICGMADFLAPEIIKGQGHGPAADWWALGVLIYFMLQTELPFGPGRIVSLTYLTR